MPPTPRPTPPATGQPGRNVFTNTPDGFKKYMQDNAERMKGWSSTPYYIKDNPQYFDQTLHHEI